MIRIVGREKPKPKEPPKLEHKSNVLLQVIGIIIADKPAEVKKLLENYGVAISEKADEHELIEKMLQAVGQGDHEFNRDLAELILDSTLDSNYDSFDFKSLLGSNGGGGSGANNTSGDTQSSGGGGGGILGGITGAIGGIGNAISSGIQKKQASAQTLQGVLAYRQQQSQTQQSKGKMKTQMLLGLFFLFGICILAIVALRKRQQQKLQLTQAKA